MQSLMVLMQLCYRIGVQRNGKYPVEAVATMNEIASHVEQIIDYHKLMSEFTLHVNLLQSDESTAFNCCTCCK